jgi:hypothetical protein
MLKGAIAIFAFSFFFNDAAQITAQLPSDLTPPTSNF